MEADLLEMQCAVLAALREVTGALLLCTQKCFCSLLYIALHVRFCSQCLAECTGASAAGLRPYICEMWCSAMQEPAHGLLCLWGPALCHMLSQQRVAGGLAQLQVVTCSMLLCFWGQSFRSCAAAAGCHSRCSPQERKAVAQMMPWAAECWERQRTLLVFVHLANPALSTAASPVWEPTAAPNVSWGGC